MIDKTKNLPESEAVPVDGGGLAIDKKDVGTGKFIKAESQRVQGFQRFAEPRFGANQSSPLDLLESLKNWRK